MNFLEVMGAIFTTLVTIGMVGAIWWFFIEPLWNGVVQFVRVRAVAKRRGYNEPLTIGKRVFCVMEFGFRGADIIVDGGVIVPYLRYDKIRKVRYPFV